MDNEQSFTDMINWIHQILIEDMKSKGNLQIAEEIDKALRVGGTSSELLGSIRLLFIKYQGSKQFSLMQRRKIKYWLKRLDNVLGQRVKNEV